MFLWPLNIRHHIASIILFPKYSKNVFEEEKITIENTEIREHVCLEVITTSVYFNCDWSQHYYITFHSFCYKTPCNQTQMDLCTSVRTTGWCGSTK